MHARTQVFKATTGNAKRIWIVRICYSLCCGMFNILNTAFLRLRAYRCVCLRVYVCEREEFQQGVFKTCCSLSRWSGRGFAYIHSWAYWSFNGTCRRLNEGESGWEREEGGGKQGEQNTGRGRRLSRQHISLACMRNFTMHSDKMAVKRLKRYFGYLFQHITDKMKILKKKKKFLTLQPWGKKGKS